MKLIKANKLLPKRLTSESESNSSNTYSTYKSSYEDTQIAEPECSLGLDSSLALESYKNDYSEDNDHLDLINSDNNKTSLTESDLLFNVSEYKSDFSEDTSHAFSDETYLFDYKTQYEDDEDTIEKCPVTPTSNLNTQTPKNVVFLLRSPREPRINTHSVKEIMLKKYRFLYSGNLRYYDEEKGFFAEVDNHASSVLAYSVIPDAYKSYVTFRDIKDTINLLKVTPSIQLPPENIPTNKDYINTLDKVLDLRSLTLKEHSHDYIFLNYINACYKDEVEFENTIFSEFIKTITGGDSELERLIKQYTGYALSNLNNSKTAAILYGEPNSGKSVFLNLLIHLCGEENVSNVEFQKLSDKKYTALLFGKLLNVCNELPDTDITDTGMFKALVSETDKVSARKLYCQPFSFYNRAKLLFATNNLPKIICKSNKDNTAFFNRIIIIPFNYSIPEERQDKDLFKKLQNEADVIFSWAVSGLMEYIENGYKFSYCQVSQESLNRYKSQNSTMETFIEEVCTINPDSYTFKSTLIDTYNIFCKIKGLDAPTSSDLKLLQSILQKKYNLQYRKIHRGGENKYGFWGLGVNTGM